MKVVITGVGLITSLGNTVEEVFSSLLENRTGVRHMEGWDRYNGLHCHLGAPAMPYDEKVIPRQARRTMSRMSEMSLLTCAAAMQQADFRPTPFARRTALLLGSTTGSPEVLEGFYDRLFKRGGPEGQLGTTFFKVMNHSVTSNVALGLEFSGPVAAIASACSTSSQAMALGWELIQSGLYDVVIAGGTDELHYTSAAVFDIVGAASRGYNDKPDQAPRPFDESRDGLVVSEGAASIVMESDAHARKRGAMALAELASGSYLSDGKHMSQPQADSMIEVMRMSLERARLEPKDIDYVNAHATGTRLGDSEEAKATAALFGDRVPVSSLKGHFGHSLAACGTLEIIMGMEMMRRGVLIPTRNLHNISSDCVGVQLIQEKKPAAVRTFISNNFAFGGMSTSLVILSPSEA